MKPVAFIITGLAVWRLSHALVKEKGPLMVFARLRAYLASSQKRSGGLFDAISCVSCLSLWVALVASLIVSDSAPWWIINALALSGYSMFLESLFSKKLNTLPLVTPPAADDQIAVGASTASKKRDFMIGDPHPSDRSFTIEA